MKKLRINHGELLKQLLARNNDLQIVETSTIPMDDGDTMVLETVIVNGTLQLIIVSDADESVVIT